MGRKPEPGCIPRVLTDILYNVHAPHTPGHGRTGRATLFLQQLPML